MADNRGMKIGKESTWGTSVAVATAINFIKMTFNREDNTTYQETVGYQEPITQSKGKYSFSGDIDMQAVPDEFAYFLASLFGGVSSSNITGDAYEHILTVDETAKHWTADCYQDAFATNLTSMTVKKGVLKLVPGQDAFWTFSYITENDIRAATAAPTFTTDKKSFHATHSSFTIGGVANATIRAIEYTFEKKLDEDNYTVESRFLKEPHMGIMHTKISVDLEFATENELRRFYDGTITSNTPADEDTEFEITTILEHDEIETGHKYGMTIETPKVTWKTEKSTEDRREHIIQNVQGEAVYSTSDSYGVRIKLTNKINDYSL